MTQFAPRHLCEKLQAVGCKSESRFNYIHDPRYLIDENTPISDDKFIAGSFNSHGFCSSDTDYTPAFTLLDLIGPSEQARSNAVKWWRDEEIEFEVETIYDFEQAKTGNFNYHRHKLIDLKSDAEAWEYVERTQNK